MLFLVLLPLLASAEISIKISAGVDYQVDVDYSGVSSDVISDRERILFGITDEPLKDAVRAYSGGRPADVFVRSPTPWQDLYKRYNWPQVKRFLKPIKYQILNAKNYPAVIKSQEFINLSTKTVTYDTSMTEEVTDTVEIKWNNIDNFEEKQPIEYAIKTGVNFTSTFSFKSDFGRDIMKNIEYKIGTKNGASFQLLPGQKAVSELKALKWNIDIEMIYLADLEGMVACNYPKKFKDHHFWAYDINGIFNRAGLKRDRVAKEVISIGFYSDAKIIVIDDLTSQQLYELDTQVY